MTAQAHFPEAFLQRLEQIIPAPCWQQVLDSFHLTPATTFRVNTLKTDIPTLTQELARERFQLQPVPWKEDAFAIPHAQRQSLTQSDAFSEGRIYIQNLSSMLPPLLLEPQQDEWILDLAAAPGSKTTQLACMMQNQGKISAVEPVKSRFFRLKANLERHGVNNVQTYLKDGSRVGKSCPEQFDRILLDVPCSSEARFRASDPASFSYWSMKKVKEMQRKQLRLITSAVQSLKPDGTLVYSTCSFAPEENEFVVHKTLERFDGALEITPIELPLKNIQNGLYQWGKHRFHSSVANAMRILPNEWMEAFFVCRMRKTKSTLTEQ